ncbi:MAG TPA: hypothetical protein VFS20_21665 [Longimicrobium sp.]|nr:hypothetical protein [Longimicrobium sp.]
MSFDLRIHFVGLAMYVPDGQAMHVLLPSAKHAHEGGGHHVEEHFSRIVYDSAYEHRESTELSREYVFVDFERRVLDLRGLPVTGGFVPNLPGELPPIERVAAEPVDRAKLTDLPDESLAGRVSMAKGALTDYTLGARFTLNGGEARRMATETEWTIRGVESRDENGEPALPGGLLPGPEGAGEVKLPNLYPIGETIHLMVFDAVAEVFPPGGIRFEIEKPEEPDVADHFVAYYNICRKRDGLTRADSLPVPADAKPVLVRGEARVHQTGPQTPSLGCVQTQGSAGGGG